MAKKYTGKRTTDGRVVVTVWVGDVSAPLAHIVRHSPDGFNWGYGGSGPAELALAILADFLGKQPLPWQYQLFKWDYVAKWSGDEFTIDEAEIAQWLKGVE